MTAPADRLPEWLVALLMSGLLIAAAGLAAWLTRQPLLFPSLGPTVYLQVESPQTRRASPRNTVIGHLVAIAVGWAALATFGLTTTAPATQIGVTPARVGAVVVALALTAALTVATRTSHPPAAATTLLVAMGTFRTGRDLVMLAAGVVLLTIVAFAANRARGVGVPLWSAT